MKYIDYGDLKYKGYFIHHGYGYFAKFNFVHENYDGASDSKDHRHGHGDSIEDCIEQIEEQLTENL